MLFVVGDTYKACYPKGLISEVLNLCVKTNGCVGTIPTYRV